MRWVLRLIATGDDVRCLSTDLVEICRPEGLGDVANLGLTLAEAKRLLADLERVGYLPRVWLAPHSVQELRRLVRYRQQLADDRRDLKLRLGAMPPQGRPRPPAAILRWYIVRRVTRWR